MNTSNILKAISIIEDHYEEIEDTRDYIDGNFFAGVNKRTCIAWICFYLDKDNYPKTALEYFCYDWYFVLSNLLRENREWYLIYEKERMLAELKNILTEKIPRIDLIKNIKDSTYK